MNKPSYVLIDDAYDQEFLLVAFDTEDEADAFVAQDEGWRRRIDPMRLDEPYMQHWLKFDNNRKRISNTHVCHQ